MSKRLVLSAFTLFLIILSIPATLPAQEWYEYLYPPIEPLRSGYLQVSDIHQLYWEVCGNEEGIPGTSMRCPVSWTLLPRTRNTHNCRAT